ncbi:rabenosyn-5 isoform X2 [Arctopsyche grandis]|uniref:rabenosyn-5 isoform X2 n=1 Tax=Arctopsyche grandis TaxID=121162 RepID=UPI00406D8BEE
MSDTPVDGDIIEGFLCPICKTDLKTPDQLTSHFETLHKEDQDVLKSLKLIFGKAKKKILNLDESDLKETFDRALRFTPEIVTDYCGHQQFGNTRSLSEYFKAVRSAKLERYTAETNKLLIRLDKLVANMPTDQTLRKIYEQEVVPWLDGSSVKLCPGCAKPFNITRRQHHCRLCGSILCNDCSGFFDLNVARCMIDPSLNMTQLQSNSDPSKTGLRLCEHCYNLIELRKQLQESRNSKTILVTGYEQMRSIMEQATPAVAMYSKMCSSLMDGETAYHLADVSILKSRIAKYAEGIDSLSKDIAALQIAQAGSRTSKLQMAIRQAATHFIKEELVSLPPVPSETEINEIRRIKREETEKRIELERRQMQINMNKRRTLGDSTSTYNTQEKWNNHNDSIPDNSVDNPLVEQMNIIRGYIKEAREKMEFEEVAILEQNLRELKQEYHYQMSRSAQ